MPVILALKKLTQDYQFQVSLGYTVRVEESGGGDGLKCASVSRVLI